MKTFWPTFWPTLTAILVAAALIGSFVEIKSHLDTRAAEQREIAARAAAKEANRKAPGLPGRIYRRLEEAFASPTPEP